MGNVMNPYGIGPVDLRDVTVLRMEHLHLLPAIVWQLLCLAGIIGGGVLLWAMIHSFGNLQRSDRPSLYFLLIFVVLYFLVMLAGGTYDRYLIPLIPALSVLLLTGLAKQDDPAPVMSRRLGGYAAVFFFMVGAWFSVSGTTNYLSWNRARWNGLRYLIYETGIPPTRIDGGFEFNGYYSYNDDDVTYLKEKADPAKKSWWWVHDDAYMIAFGPVKGYTVLKTFPCLHTFFPFSSSKNIFVLKRTP